MGSSHQELIADMEYKLRLVTFNHEAEKHLRYLFHDSRYGNFPTDESALYNLMKMLDKGRKLNHLRSDQRALVLPDNEKTDSKKFDTTLLSYFLLTHAKLPKSMRKNIKGIKEQRDYIMHNDITYDEFRKRWNNMKTFLGNLGYDINIVKDLKSGNLDDLEQFQVSINKGKIEIQELNIQKNADDIEINRDDITLNRHDIEVNRDDIEVNRDDIDVNRFDIEVNRDNIGVNTDDIKVNRDDIEVNRDDIEVNKDDIEVNRNYIEVNRSDIALNRDDIKVNRDDIKVNRDDIEVNRDDIEVNRDDIEVNKDDIEVNRNDIEVNRSDIALNRDDIKVNRDDIEVNRDDIEVNKDDIEVNRNYIEVNRSEIALNRDDIKVNRDDIEVNRDNIEGNKDGIKVQKDVINDHERRINTMEKKMHIDSSGQDGRQGDETLANNKLSFEMYKNMQDNIVVRFHDENFQSIHKIMTKNKDESVTQLEPSKHFHEERKENKLVITVYKDTSQVILEVLVTLLKSEGSMTDVTIKDISCPHWYKQNGFSLLTHNCDLLSSEMAAYATTEPSSSNIKFVCCGKVQEMSHSQYKGFSRSYVNDYFTRGEFLTEKIQFPPYNASEIISQFAFTKVTNVMSECEHHFVVLTHYNAMENIVFLNLNQSVHSHELPDSKQRVLFFYPHNNTFVNIRYTETTDDSIVRKEFLNGEADIKLLSVVNHEYILNCDLKFVNVVAAPNFEKTIDSDICKDCHLLDRHLISSDAHIRRFFYHFLYGENSSSDDSCKEQYMNMLGQMMCFMAARDGLYDVPTVNEDIHEKISTLILTSQQLRCLHNASKKKIIIGPLGSGKTVLALAHLDYYYQQYKMQSVIYYILWSDKTLLLVDVRRFSKKLWKNENVSIKIMSIVEIAKELDFLNIPTVSQLIKALLKKHGNVPFSLIGDEIDGEMFGSEETSPLKHMFETKDSFEHVNIVLFPQSLEKHRKFVSPSGTRDHAKFKYNETGMDVIYLNKSMRTTVSNFNFLSEFEKEMSVHESVIKHPVDESDQDVPTDTQNVILGSEIRIADGRKEYDSTIDRQPIEESDSTSIELALDIDFIAATTDNEDASDHNKTLTKVECNTAELSGNNIKGEKPILIHINHEHEAEDLPIVLLSVALKNICLSRANSKRLFFYHTENQMKMFKKILALLESEYVVYTEETEWKYVRSDGAVVESLPEGGVYNILTNVMGCRGAEFSESICAIDLNDTKLRHIALEGMSRATNRLIIVSTCNINSAVEGKSSTGNIMKKLLPTYMIELCIESSTNPDEGISYTEGKKGDIRTTAYVNIRSWQFKQLMDKVGKIKFDHKVLQKKDPKQAIINNLHPPKKVGWLQCHYKSETECTLQWMGSEGYNYVIKTKNKNSQWEVTGNVISSTRHVVDGLIHDEIYEFCVNAQNRVGESPDSVISYLHRSATATSHLHLQINISNIIKLVEDNKIDKLKELLKLDPNIIHMRDDEYQNTPLIWTAFYTDSKSTIELFISNGSNVWEQNSYKSNVYHYAAGSGRHNILQVLCDHDVTYINSVNANHQTPLHWAAVCGHTECVGILLRHPNIDIYIKDKNYNTANDVAGIEKNKQNRKIIKDMIRKYAKSKRKSKK